MFQTATRFFYGGGIGARARVGDIIVGTVGEGDLIAGAPGIDEVTIGEAAAAFLGNVVDLDKNEASGIEIGVVAHEGGEDFAAEIAAIGTGKMAVFGFKGIHRGGDLGDVVFGLSSICVVTATNRRKEQGQEDAKHDEKNECFQQGKALGGFHGGGLSIGIEFLRDKAGSGLVGRELGMSPAGRSGAQRRCYS